jgi:hypothetical protein
MKCGAAPSGTLAAPDSFKAGGDIDAVSKDIVFVDDAPGSLDRPRHVWSTPSPILHTAGLAAQ